MLRRVASQYDIEGGQQFSVAFLWRRSTTSEPPLNALQLQEMIVALDAVDIVGTLKRYDEWLALAQ